MTDEAMLSMRETIQAALQAACPDEPRLRVATLGVAGDDVSASVSVRGGRMLIGFELPQALLDSPQMIVLAFKTAVENAGYAGIINVVAPEPETSAPMPDDHPPADDEVGDDPDLDALDEQPVEPKRKARR